MNTITLYAQDADTCYAKKYTDSELLLGHINHGERYLYGKSHYDDICKLATAHGWAVKLVTERKW